VVEHDDRISGYSTGLANFGHTAGETNEDLKALIGAASEFAGPRDPHAARQQRAGRLVPSQWPTGRTADDLMTIGLYNEPARFYLPSIHY
jgi:hypothetical protein